MSSTKKKHEASRKNYLNLSVDTSRMPLLHKEPTPYPGQPQMTLEVPRGRTLKRRRHAGSSNTGDEVQNDLRQPNMLSPDQICRALDSIFKQVDWFRVAAEAELGTVEHYQQMFRNMIYHQVEDARLLAQRNTQKQWAARTSTLSFEIPGHSDFRNQQEEKQIEKTRGVPRYTVIESDLDEGQEGEYYDDDDEATEPLATQGYLPWGPTEPQMFPG